MVGRFTFFSNSPASRLFPLVWFPHIQPGQSSLSVFASFLPSSFRLPSLVPSPPLPSPPCYVRLDRPFLCFVTAS
ncbi:hypothetical protein LZ31DRAFT_317208 [Colletotrichum somersetense]|nr:hypothetical protein LZ31DRAFT_317208 [Colletotrichum somersetense]